MGEDAERWRTFPGARLVVAIARTVTSTVRLLDVLGPVLRDDPRIDLVFAYDPTSAFNDGVHALLRSVAARVLPWPQFGRTRPDLVITATENADLATADHDCPVLVLPHGAGFHKTVPDSRSDRDRLAGLVPDALLRTGRVWFTISHPDQAAQLAAAHPATAGRTLLIGDPCYDALLDGRNLRDRYRRALGVRDDRRLIMLSSTWRDHSLLGRDPALPARLLAELPLDDYAVALVTHPNITAAHSGYTLRSHLASAHDAGLLAIPPTAGWQATLLAADLLIGDHGSVTFYGAALGTPLLLGAFGEDEAVAGTPMAELGRIAPRLRPQAPLRPQIERALGDGPPPGDGTAERLRKVGESAFAAPGRALELLRTAVYDLLCLPEPAAAPPPRPAPEPPVLPDPPEPLTACHFHTSLSDGPDGPRVAVERTPATVAAFSSVARNDLPGGPFRHLSCADDATDRQWPESASVLFRRAAADSVVAADRWIDDTLARYPGCRLAATTVAGRGCRAGLRDGRTVELSATGLLDDPAVLAAVVYTCLRARRPLEGFVTLALADRTEDVALRLTGQRGKQAG
ncbi:CDP-glycerol glycerophosphotransferase family protein [Streptomyces sp. RS10V-4]|uniref:CDP-glycerol glycerophosphotransferase family protein n=1 Tax=Streptomyces rhizoryzae TaxID=2932493 RepID=UPI002005F3CF|nr:CDP-glycerol glycerophosphotransferase family protein [Streptomyces rhizoryzae]MCK7622018.1 CDP-glycerol glycerophosphotransferase family protein [Streptomyces rhizoryzae]